MKLRLGCCSFTAQSSSTKTSIKFGPETAAYSSQHIPISPIAVPKFKFQKTQTKEQISLYD